MAVSHFAYNMMKIPTAWGVIKVKTDIDDAIYCIQKLKQTVATMAETRQDVMEVGANAFSGDGWYPGGSTSTSSKKASFHGDPPMTNKVALTSDGSRTITIGAHLADK